MTLQEFAIQHPFIKHYERAGVDGIDFAALHERINASRFLQTRQSFIYIIKNYNAILRGDFDDFKEIKIKDKYELEEEARVNRIRQRRLKLKQIDLTDSFIQQIKAEHGLWIDAWIKDILETYSMAISKDNRHLGDRADEMFDTLVALGVVEAC